MGRFDSASGNTNTNINHYGNTKEKESPVARPFWSLIKETLGYEEAYKDVIKEGLVNQYSGGKTCSLSEMYKKYPTEYSNMLEAMKGNTEQRRVRYDEDRDKAAKRVIAAISSWLDKLGYKYPTPTDKIRYAMAVACRPPIVETLMQYPKAG